MEHRCEFIHTLFLRLGVPCGNLKLISCVFLVIANRNHGLEPPAQDYL